MAILITGAGGGLGGAVVQAFLGSGATVYGVDRKWKQAPQHPHFHAVEADIFESGECDRAAKAAAPVDALVHLVGGFGGGKPVAETEDEVWEQMLDLNLRAAYSIFRATLPQMLKARRGRIIAIGSRAAVEPLANFAPYCVAKAALVTLIKTLALELKNSGVTANVVLPSVIDTAANRASNPGADFSAWVRPESIAGLLVWLASDASRDLNGAAIPIYGRA